MIKAAGLTPEKLKMLRDVITDEIFRAGIF